MKLKQLNKKESFIFFHFPSKIIYHFYYFLFPFSFFLYLFSCNHSTSPQTLTSSGMVTLADTSDYSGVEVMLFKPIEIDTALTNLNKQYPGVGIELTQRTEFYWREHEPAYQTTTDASGHWKIAGVEAGTYHLVVNKEGYGWRVLYDTDARNETTITMKKALIWQGTYTEPVTVPENSFVQVTGNTVFEQGLSVEPGVVIEFKNKENTTPQEKIKITIYGNLKINGTTDHPVYIVADDSSNYNNIEINDAATAQVTYCIARWMYNPFYLKNVPLVQVENSRFDKDKIGLAINNSDSALVKNNFITRIGIDGMQTFDTHLNLQRNTIYDCTNFGLRSKSSNNSIVKYNVLKKCKNYGIALNFKYFTTYLDIKNKIKLIFNDFSSNNNHIFVGLNIMIVCNVNNFFNSENFHIVAKLNKRLKTDTLNFKNNYWGYIKNYLIETKIYDIRKNDTTKYHGPIIDYSYFKLKGINWIHNL